MSLRRWWTMLGVPHVCQDCGKPLSFGANGAGRFAALCPDMWLSLGDGYTEHNYSGHTMRVTESRPDWGNCGHQHEERSLLRGYPV